ncbi:hypothetical protein [Pseudobutyrivibrio xylanivorans]|uniref:Uncharacterized protein n=1 Tax=Pseudobutyrivibrio xylanivorans TaxID=185007 RepID=A0A5P6VLJ8_PSEXY|nr:hypothetical protein [Pseudobutyrivibrio xylanivorans]QFJ53437.1 hypothetical protein FXF36_00385 [Pseudobutyrivibrio xylanivorans]
MTLFDEYIASNNMTGALLIGRNSLNKNPGDKEIFCKYTDLLLSLAEKLPSLKERKNFANQAGVTLAFFEENAELSTEVIELIMKYRKRIGIVAESIDAEDRSIMQAQYENTKAENTDVIKKLYQEKEKLEKANNQNELDAVLIEIGTLDSALDHEYLTDEQKNHYDMLNREYTELISKKMGEIEKKNNIAYNKDAVDSFNKAFHSFKADEGKYKNQSQLFNLVSTTLFAYDAGKLFNESLIYYNHVYSYIFSKLDDDGKLALTRFSIECERKLG